MSRGEEKTKRWRSWRPRFSVRTLLALVLFAAVSTASLRYWLFDRKVETVVFLKWMSAEAIAPHLKRWAAIDDEIHDLRTESRFNAVIVTCRIGDRERIVALIQEMDASPAPLRTVKQLP